MTHLRVVYTARDNGKLVATDSRVIPLDMPKINIICGKKEVCWRHHSATVACDGSHGWLVQVPVHQKVKCQIAFWNPMVGTLLPSSATRSHIVSSPPEQPWALDASLEVIISGNTRLEHKLQPKKIGAKVPGTDREKYVGRWTNVEVPTTTAGPAELIAVIRSPHLNMVRGTHHITVKGPEQTTGGSGGGTGSGSGSSPAPQPQPQPQPNKPQPQPQPQPTQPQPTQPQPQPSHS